MVNALNGRVNQLPDSFQRQIEGEYGAFQPLEQVDAHQPLNAEFTSLHGQVRLAAIHVFIQLAGENVVGRRIDAQRQGTQQLIDLVVIDCLIQIREIGAQADGLQPFREFSDFAGIVVSLDMLAGTGNGHAVQHFKKVEIQRAQQRIRRALFRFQLAPCVEGTLCLPKDFIDGLCRVQPLIHDVCIALISQRKLIAQVVETIVDRRCGQHQHLRFDARPDDLAHQYLIAVFPVALVRTGSALAVSEIVRLVDHDQVIVPPIQAIQIQPIGCTAVSRQIRVEQHVVIQAVNRNGVVDVIIPIGVPVGSQLLGA